MVTDVNSKQFVGVQVTAKHRYHPTRKRVIGRVEIHVRNPITVEMTEADMLKLAQPAMFESVTENFLKWITQF